MAASAEELHAMAQNAERATAALIRRKSRERMLAKSRADLAEAKRQLEAREWANKIAALPPTDSEIQTAIEIDRRNFALGIVSDEHWRKING